MIIYLNGSLYISQYQYKKSTSIRIRLLPEGLSKPLSSLLLLSLLRCSSSFFANSFNRSRSLCLSWHLARASSLSFSRAASRSSRATLLSLSRSRSLSLSLESRLSLPRLLSEGLLSLALDLKDYIYYCIFFSHNITV